MQGIQQTVGAPLWSIGIMGGLLCFSAILFLRKRQEGRGEDEAELSGDKRPAQDRDTP